jgi:hypothetical protein
MSKLATTGNMEDGMMRHTILGLMLASALAAGCNRSETATPGNAFAAPADAKRDASAAPVATVGRADTPRPAEAAPAVWREVTLPAGTQLAVTLDTAVGSDSSRVEEPVTAHLARPILLHGDTVLAEGTRVNGVVTDATRSAKVKGRAHVAMRFDSLTPRGEDQRYNIRTASVTRTAQGTKKKDALKIGAPAAGGAILGAILGGKKGAAIGAGVGGGAGTAVVLSTRGEEVHLTKGSPITLKLAAPLTVRVKG